MIVHVHVAFRVMLIALMCYAQGLSAGISTCSLPICCPPKVCGRGFIEGEFLYWRAYRGGLDRCVSFESSEKKENGEVVSRCKGKRNDPHFEWRPGYRVGVGFLSNRCWDIAAYWTDFHSRTDEKHRSTDQHRSGDQHHRSSAQHRSSDQEPSCAQRQRWELDFQVVDLLMGYKLCMNSCFNFRPFIGVRAVKIEQTVKACRSKSLPFSIVGEHHKEKFCGVGPLLGLEAKVKLRCGFSLYADAATSILYGNNNVNFRNCDRFKGRASSSRLRQHLNGYQAVFDAAIGIAFESCFCNNMRLILKLGAEHHGYFDFNHLGSHEDLNLDGGTFSAAIVF